MIEEIDSCTVSNAGPADDIQVTYCGPPATRSNPPPREASQPVVDSPIPVKPLVILKQKNIIKSYEGCLGILAQLILLCTLGDVPARLKGARLTTGA
jgi:hypothetical protein